MNNTIVTGTTAEVRIELSDDLIDIIIRALKPEIDSPSSERSSTEILVDKKSIVIRIVASDTTALRASLNSYLRWIHGIFDMVEKLD